MPTPAAAMSKAGTSRACLAAARTDTGTGTASARRSITSRSTAYRWPRGTSGVPSCSACTAAALWP
eukprot:8019618-Pyramimonas_sp.AAC.1